ncbi:hypothetical protein [Cryptosporangium phraense]|uniref:Alpha/beta hydrolase n=1 Tax=Cryptosporangium phraense TaxID=2593070 RepID=A0A545AP31_9ACTN|nr:hypothetical protein [Cryptosporangium phraense]TQS43088.1 hypothetical protein FL583_21910 [Cryptosporangium phraense]
MGTVSRTFGYDGGRSVTVVVPSGPPEAVVFAGDGEPFFLGNAVRWAEALGAAGADVVLAKRPGGHGGPFWRAEFPAMVAWAFPRP